MFTEKSYSNPADATQPQKERKKEVKNHVGKERKIHREKEKTTRKSSFFLQEEKAAHGT
jgi:hypothetical protein